MSYPAIETLYDRFLTCRRVCTDTRQLQQGDLFFALKGENFDGNQFAAQALAAGAAYAVVDDPQVAVTGQFLLVENTLSTLQDLARHRRRQLNIPILAITGSNGKTTTKELVAAVLATTHLTHFTQGNFNNHIGVPLTLLALPDDTEIAVIEMGANHVGEIAALCEIAEPTHGLITNVGLAHLEGFGGFEGVKRGKSELYRYLARNKGVVFVNLEEPHLSDLAQGVDRIIGYKFAAHPRVDIPYYELQVKQVSPRIEVAFLDARGQFHPIHSHLSGKHNLQNISTVVAVAKYFKVPAAGIVAAIESYQPTNNRSQWLEKEGIHYLLDAYNANPTSMRASLISFAELAGTDKIAILGDMLELGDQAAAEHLAMAQLAQSLPIGEVFLIGPLFQTVAEQLGMPHFQDANQFLAATDRRSWVGKHVLIKGSRGMRLEKIVA
jgi:UDP-N-acetylmuramoyl-tripeptide--D-alanyl-D-alanine ligase